jgi:hypothetical protein
MFPVFRLHQQCWMNPMLCKKRDIFMTRDSPGFIVFVFVVFLLNIKRTAPFSAKHLQLVVNKLRYASF